MRRFLSVLTGAILACALIPAGSTGAVDRLPDGSRIAGVDVSGLGPVGAERALRDALEAPYTRPLTVRVRAKDTAVSTGRAGFSVDYDWMVGRAFKLADAGRRPNVKLDTDIDAAKLDALVAALRKPWYRAAHNARVRFGITKVVRIRHRTGQALDRDVLRNGLIAELTTPTENRVVKAPVRVVRPKITTSKLGSVYGTYVSIDKRELKLRLFKRLRIVRTYGIAIGAAGFETPSGLRHVLSKTRNPAWHAPNKPWAGQYAGQTIPPGDPRNPLKYAFVALGDGIGFHGTAEEWSIGSRASHGCIRMRVRDIKQLYPKVPVGTPVLIR